MGVWIQSNHEIFAHGQNHPQLVVGVHSFTELEEKVFPLYPMAQIACKDFLKLIDNQYPGSDLDFNGCVLRNIATVVVSKDFAIAGQPGQKLGQTDLGKAFILLLALAEASKQVIDKDVVDFVLWFGGTRDPANRQYLKTHFVQAGDQAGVDQ